MLKHQNKSLELRVRPLFLDGVAAEPLSKNGCDLTKGDLNRVKRAPYGKSITHKVSKSDLVDAIEFDTLSSECKET